MNLDDDNDADDEKADETKAADAEQTGPEIYVGTATPVADDVLAVSIAVPQLASTSRRLRRLNQLSPLPHVSLI